jgi:hypothetical protein
MHITGKCHCGNIAFSLDWPGDPAEIPARACDCTFCVKHGGVWTSHPDASLAATVAETAFISNYAFGTRTATFHVCSRCGTVPLATCEIDNRLYAVVNVNTFENVDPAKLRNSAASLEGEDVASRLARRKRNWIADVRIADRRTRLFIEPTPTTRCFADGLHQSSGITAKELAVSTTPMKFEHTSLAGAQFNDVNLNAARFDDVNLQHATFTNVALTGATFDDVSLRNVSIADCNLEGMRINGILVSEMLIAYGRSTGSGN